MKQTCGNCLWFSSNRPGRQFEKSAKADALFRNITGLCENPDVELVVNSPTEPADDCEEWTRFVKATRRVKAKPAKEAPKEFDPFDL